MKTILKYIIGISSFGILLSINSYIPQTTPLTILLVVLFIWYQNKKMKNLIKETQTNVELIESIQSQNKILIDAQKSVIKSIKELRKNQERLKEAIEAIKTNKKFEFNRIFSKIPDINDAD
jgi:hypothetical protein